MARPHRDTSLLVAVLCTVAAAWTAGPAAAASGSGGTPATTPVPPSAGGVGYGDPKVPSLLARPGTLLGRTLHVRGTLPGAAGRRVIIQRLDPRRGWQNAAHARVRSTGRFLVRWRTDRSGRHLLRAVVADRHGRVRARTTAAPATRVTVYRTAKATWYGPGFFGRRTACGQEMTPELVGVAHRSLPCGTPVEVLHAGRTLVVPVVDRGPYHAGFSYDLTQAAALLLGFDGARTVGVMRAAPAGT